MGGFMLHDGDRSPGVLSPERFEELVGIKSIDMPSVSEEDTHDRRNKEDDLSRALVIAQTSWFFGQCIARRVRDLVVTQLELVSLALATLNGAMYFFWWNKPSNVESAVPEFLKSIPVRDVALMTAVCRLVQMLFVEAPDVVPS